MRILSLLIYAILCHTVTSYRVAIIGGGISGTSFAYYLKNTFQKNTNKVKPEIVLFEKNEIGGRIKTVTIGNCAYEAGASIIHPRNKLFKDLMNDFNLTTASHDDNGGTTAFYDSTGILFQTSPNSLITMAKAFWRYHFDYFSMVQLVKRYLDQFDRIYKLLDSKKSFSSIEKIISSMSDELIQMTKHYIAQLMIHLSYSIRFVNEMVRGAVRGNYGQDVTVQSFVGLVSLAGVDPGLFSVSGGNVLVPLNCFEKSAARRVDANVLAVHSVEDGRGEKLTKKYLIEAEMAADGQRANFTDFDVVLLATPMIYGKKSIEFYGFQEGDSSLQRLKHKYQKTVATFVVGKANYRNFGYSSADSFPEMIMNVDGQRDSVYFNAMAIQKPVGRCTAERDGAHVWKVFSKQPLTEEQLDKLFSERRSVQSFQWLAYPKYGSEVSQWQEFLVDGNALYFANSCEYAASAMEMQLICSKNIAQLVYNRFTNANNNIDPPVSFDENIKTEL